MRTHRILSQVVSLFVVAGSLLITSKVTADTMYVWAEEVAGSVIFYHQGSIDLTDFPGVGTISLTSQVNPSNPTFANGEPSPDYYTGVFSPIPMFGAGGMTAATGATGDTFGFAGSALVLPNGYTSETPISGSMTFSPATFNSLGVDTTPYSFDTTVGANTIRMFTSPPVSVPADNSALKTSLTAKIKKLQKKAKKLKKKGQKAKAKKLTKKVKKLKKQLLQLG